KIGRNRKNGKRTTRKRKIWRNRRLIFFQTPYTRKAEHCLCFFYGRSPSSPRCTQIVLGASMAVRPCGLLAAIASARLLQWFCFLCCFCDGLVKFRRIFDFILTKPVSYMKQIFTLFSFLCMAHIAAQKW